MLFFNVMLIVNSLTIIILLKYIYILIIYIFNHIIVKVVTQRSKK